MTGFELYVFFLCLIVFIALTALFSFFIFYVGKQKIIIIKNGIADEEITQSLNKRIDKMANKNYRIFDTIEKIVSVSLCAVLCVLFILVGISFIFSKTFSSNF